LRSFLLLQMQSRGARKLLRSFLQLQNAVAQRKKKFAQLFEILNAVARRKKTFAQLSAAPKRRRAAPENFCAAFCSSKTLSRGAKLLRSVLLLQNAVARRQNTFAQHFAAPKRRRAGTENFCAAFCCSKTPTCCAGKLSRSFLQLQNAVVRRQKTFAQLFAAPKRRRAAQKIFAQRFGGRKRVRAAPQNFCAAFWRSKTRSRGAAKLLRSVLEVENAFARRRKTFAQRFGGRKRVRAAPENFCAALNLEVENAFARRQKTFAQRFGGRKRVRAAPENFCAAFWRSKTRSRGAAKLLRSVLEVENAFARRRKTFAQRFGGRKRVRAAPENFCAALNLEVENAFARRQKTFAQRFGGRKRVRAAPENFCAAFWRSKTRSRGATKLLRSVLAVENAFARRRKTFAQRFGGRKRVRAAPQNFCAAFWRSKTRSPYPSVGLLSDVRFDVRKASVDRSFFEKGIPPVLRAFCLCKNAKVF